MGRRRNVVKINLDAVDRASYKLVKRNYKARRRATLLEEERRRMLEERSPFEDTCDEIALLVFQFLSLCVLPLLCAGKRRTDNSYIHYFFTTVSLYPEVE